MYADSSGIPSSPAAARKASSRGSGEDESFDLLPDLARVRCPTLVLGGEDDPITPIGDQEDIVAALPAGRGRLERFAGCGHGVHRDDPARALAVLRQFLAE